MQQLSCQVYDKLVVEQKDSSNIAQLGPYLTRLYLDALPVHGLSTKLYQAQIVAHVQVRQQHTAKLHTHEPLGCCRTGRDVSQLLLQFSMVCRSV